MQLVEIIEAIAIVVGAASALAAIIPAATPAVPFLVLARKVLDTVALNVGHANNAKK